MVQPRLSIRSHAIAGDHPAIEAGEADVVLGSRLMGIHPSGRDAGGEIRFQPVPDDAGDWVFGLPPFGVPHGFIGAFRRQVLESVNLQMDSDRFIFDQEILAQIVNLKMRITEVPVPTRYFAQASSASLFQSSVYGVSILWLLVRYLLHRGGHRPPAASSTAWSGVTAAPRESQTEGGLT